MKMLCIIVAALSLMALARCSDSGSEGIVIDNQAQLKSSDVGRKVVRATCDETSNRCTPTNVTGDICYAIVGLGPLGNGYFPMTWLAPEATFPSGPSSGTCSTVAFDLSSTTSFNGKIEIPASEGDMPSPPQIKRVELMYNYVDTVFTLANTAGGGTTDGAWTVRTVYATTATADDVTGTMQKGDKLIKKDGEAEFVWCGTGGCNADRGAVGTVIQDEDVADYVYPGDGNPDYVNVAVSLNTPLDVTYAQLSDTTKTWILDFTMTDGIEWLARANPSTFNTRQDIVQNFHLKFAPNQSQGGSPDDGLKADLTLQ